MAMEARSLIRRGEIGDIMVVMGEYPQDWLISMVDGAHHSISSWRLDPEITGGSNCVGDIGTHIEHTVSFMTGLKIQKLCAVMDKFGSATLLDNNAHVLVKYENGATGTYWSSQIAVGNDNALKVRIYGTEGAILFDQEQCNYLTFIKRNCPPQILSRGCPYLTPEASAYSRIPPGHLEGHHVAFANLYKAFTEDIRRVYRGEAPLKADYPGADDGIDGVKFVEKCLESANNGSSWASY
jgi:predicted dehydrogenase